MPINDQKEQLLEDEITGSLLTSGNEDDNLLNLVDKHTLQLDGDQLRELMFLHHLNNPHLDKFLAKYIEYKHYNGSAPTILEALSAIAFKRFVSLFRININATK